MEEHYSQLKIEEKSPTPSSISSYIDFIKIEPADIESESENENEYCPEVIVIESDRRRKSAEPVKVKNEDAEHGITDELLLMCTTETLKELVPKIADRIRLEKWMSDQKAAQTTTFDQSTMDFVRPLACSSPDPLSIQIGNETFTLQMETGGVVNPVVDDHDPAPEPSVPQTFGRPAAQLARPIVIATARRVDVRAILASKADLLRHLDSMRGKDRLPQPLVNLLSRTVVYYLFEKHGYYPSSEIKEEMAASVVAAWPLLGSRSPDMVLPYEGWFLPTRASGGTSASGILEARCKYFRTRLRKEGVEEGVLHRSRRVAHTSTPADITTEALPAHVTQPPTTATEAPASMCGDELERRLTWLQANPEEQPASAGYMALTARARHDIILAHPEMTSLEVLTRFPLLRLQEFVLKDFDTLWPEQTQELLLRWPLVARRILAMVPGWPQKLGITAPEDMTIGETMNAAVAVLPLSVPLRTYTIMCGNKKKRIRPTRKEQMAAFLQTIPSGTSPGLQIALRDQKAPMMLVAGNVLRPDSVYMISSTKSVSEHADLPVNGLDGKCSSIEVSRISTSKIVGAKLSLSKL